MIQSMQIKDVATFRNTPESLQDLPPINFIYGSNGSGKTTLSRILADEAGYPQCPVSWKSGRKLETVVYNQDFIEKNFVQAHHLPGVFTMGEDQAETLRKIENTKSEDSKSAAMRRCKEVCTKWKSVAPAFAKWFEEAAEESMTFYMFKDKTTRRRTKTVNVVERLNEEIRRRTRVTRLFPNEASCNRLVTVVLMQTHEKRAAEKIYINPAKMELENNYRKNVA